MTFKVRHHDCSNIFLKWHNYFRWVWMMIDHKNEWQSYLLLKEKHEHIWLMADSLELSCSLKVISFYFLDLNMDQWRSPRFLNSFWLFKATWSGSTWKIQICKKKILWKFIRNFWSLKMSETHWWLIVGSLMSPQIYWIHCIFDRTLFWKISLP